MRVRLVCETCLLTEQLERQQLPHPRRARERVDGGPPSDEGMHASRHERARAVGVLGGEAVEEHIGAQPGAKQQRPVTLRMRQ